MKLETLKMHMRYNAQVAKVGILTVTLNAAETVEELATRLRLKVHSKLEEEMNHTIAVVLDDFNKQAEAVEVPFETVFWTVDAHI